MILSAEEQRAIDGARGREPGWKIGYEATLLGIIDRQFEEIEAFERFVAAHAKDQLDLWRTLLTDALATWIKEKLIAETREKTAVSPRTDAECDARAAIYDRAAADLRTLGFEEMAENVEHERDLLYGTLGVNQPLGIMVMGPEDCRPVPFAEPVVVVIPAADEPKREDACD